MKQWGTLEIAPVATISINHIPKDCFNLLEKYLDTDAKNHLANDLPSGHWLRSLCWGSFDYGYMVGGVLLSKIGTEECSIDGDIPEFLVEASNFARDFNLAWLVYDADATELDGMTLYDY